MKLAIAFRDPIEVDRGPALAGPWRMNESEFRYVDDPSVAVHEDGTLAVVWVDNERKDVLFRSYASDGRALLPSASNVSRSPAVFSWLPRVALRAPEQVFVLWQEIVFSGGSHGGEIFFARSSDGGATFEVPRNISQTQAGDGKGRLTRERWDNGSLDLLVGQSQELYAVWTNYEGALWFSASRDDGESFEPPRQVAGGFEQPARAPALARSPAGAIWLAWTVGEDASADIHVAVSSDRGESFGPARRAARTPGHSDAPKLAVDARGTVHLAFGERAAGTEAHIFYARAEAADAQFETPRRLPTPGSASALAAFPSLSLSGPRVFVTWQHQPTASSAPNGLGFIASADGGRTFGEPSLVLAAPDPRAVTGSRQGKLMRVLASNGAGLLAIVSSHFSEGDASSVELLIGRAP
jgi:hypothetical protein